MRDYTIERAILVTLTGFRIITTQIHMAAYN